MRVCLQPGCTALVRKGRCPYHQSIKDERDKKRKEQYDVQRGSWLDRYGPDWPAVRARQLSDYPFCRDCGAQSSLTVHHLQKFNGLEDPLRTDPANLVTLCRTCHGKIDGWSGYNSRARHND